MALPVVSNVVGVQGTGGIVVASVLQITFDLANANGNASNVTVELSSDAGDNWHPCLLHASGNGQSVSAGTGRTLLVDTNASFSQAGFAARANVSTLVRLLATDATTSEASTKVESSAFMVKSTKPVITSFLLPQYIGAVLASAVPSVLASHNGDGSTAPARFRYNTALSQLDDGSGLAFVTWTDGTFNYAVPVGLADGTVYLYARTYDTFYNASDPIVAAISGSPSTQPWLQRQLPQGARIDAVGPNGEDSYAGIKIEPDGSFTVDRMVTLYLAATSQIPLQVKITPDSGVELLANINTIYTLNATNAVQEVYLTTNQSSPTVDNFNADTSVTVNVEFIDAADNVRTVSKSLRLNTRIYQAAMTPLRAIDANYSPILREVTSGGAETVIPRQITLGDNPIRTWTDIFHPATHSYPLDTDGTIHEVNAVAMGQVSTSSNDAVALANGAVLGDADGRPMTVDWSANKVYSHMLSSSVTSLTSWVIDNTGHGEIDLDFEYFDLNANSYGPPFNPIAPYEGDVLVVYDATAAGATEQVVDGFGRLQWQIDDSSKLVEIAAFTGRGSNVVNRTTGLRMNSTPVGAFQAATIRGITRLALILYTDAAGSGSGFKLKSGPAHDRVWRNYDVDARNGEVWVHKHSSLGGVSGAADTTAKRMVYDYLSHDVTINYDDGSVDFYVDPSGEVTVDYTYYTTDAWDATLYVATHDDHVGYGDQPVYVTPDDDAEVDLTSTIFEVDGHGIKTLDRTWDRDRGLVEINDPSILEGRRLYANYDHHTFLRLSNDGYGDLTFYNSIVVADDTPSFPDYTFVDIKMVNEGDAALEDGKLKFVARGYDTNNDGEVVLVGSDVIDQVLDINRPWDVQKGTKAETYSKMAAEIRDNFTWDPSLSKAEAAAILGTWANKVFGDLDARNHLFGRCVWVTGGTSGSAYPATTSGEKRTSMEVSGRFYAQEVLV